MGKNYVAYTQYLNQWPPASLLTTLPTATRTHCIKGDRRHETGDVRPETGSMWQETWDRRRETADMRDSRHERQQTLEIRCETRGMRQETWGMKHDTRYVRQETWDMIQKTWYKRQEQLFSSINHNHIDTQHFSNSNVGVDHTEKSPCLIANNFCD